MTLWLVPAVLDMATSSARPSSPLLQPGHVLRAFSYGRLVVRGPIPERAVSHVRLQESSAKDLALFDVAICDERGNEVERRSLHDAPGDQRRAADGAAIIVGPAWSVPATENPSHDGLRDGMTPAGASMRSTASSPPTSPRGMVASSVDLLDVSIAKVDAKQPGPERAAPASSGAAFERPTLSSAFEAPRTPIERDLAAMWRELLGVEDVGRNDDFFELGGQSLIAVRLFTRMRKTYWVNLPLATLFEAPTIAQSAAIVAGRLGIVDVDDDDHNGTVAADGPALTALPVPSLQPPAFRSLVTIQKGGDRVPFFCVHGLGGNVLNFRDLSVALGRQPALLRAPGPGRRRRVLPPLDTIPEMAAAYIEAGARCAAARAVHVRRLLGRRRDRLRDGPADDHGRGFGGTTSC